MPLHFLRRRPFFLGLGVVVSPPICEAFTFGSFERRDSAGRVIDAKGNAMVPLKGDFVDVALQMEFAPMLELGGASLRHFRRATTSRA